MSRRAPAALALRWCRVKIAAYLGRSAIELSFVDHTTITVDPRQSDVRIYAYWALAEFEDMSFALHLLRPGDLFVDVGGNIGAYTLIGAGACGANVVAVEPDAANFAALCANVERNALGARVEAVQRASGAEFGTVPFRANGTSGAHVLRDADVDATAARVPMMRLDDIVGQRDATLVKIDTEGYEHDVICGADRVLSRSGALAAIVELNGSGLYFDSSDTTVHRAMSARGYRACTYDPASRTLAPIETEWNRRQGNTIYVRDLAEARRRVTSAPPHRALGASI